MSWQLASFFVLALALLAGFAWYERSRPPAKVLSLVAALAALAVVGRIAFAAIPNVKPTTDMVLLAGYALGSAPGFAVGAVTALVSNFFLLQGPWTPWQMAAWGGIGVAGGLLARVAGPQLGRLPLTVSCAIAGAAFGLVMDAYQWTLGAEHTLGSYIAVSATSLPYNVAHVAGNVVFCAVAGPPFVRLIQRYRRRFEVRWEGARRTALRGGAVAALALAAGGALGGLSTTAPGARAESPGAQAASTSGNAVRYLLRAQNRDGGFGGARGQASTQLYTGWTALGLASAKRNPRDVKRAGNSVLRYIRRHAGALNDTGELTRTILVLRSAGLSTRRFRGRDLISELRERRSGNGSYASRVNTTAFAVLALRASGESGGVGESAGWLVKQQNDDGGFGFGPRGGGSDVDDTGAVLQALAAAGRGGDVVVDAVRYLRDAQNGDGGFPQMRDGDSNAQSTAWAVQGLVAAGRGTGTARRYLRRLQSRDGSIRYSKYSRQTPVWVTAQALTALRRKPFPLKPTPRKKASASGATATTTAAARERKRRARRRRAAAKAGGGGDVAGESAGGTQRVSTATPSAPGERGASGTHTAEVIGVSAVGAASGAILLGWWWRRRRTQRPLV